MKDLVIQYTTGSGVLSGRAWSNVPNLRNGVAGADLLAASAVNSDGTVTGDVHSGFASLSFDVVQATGLRISFANPSSAGTCSSNPSGPCNHYRVAEFQAHFDGSTAPPPPIGPAGPAVPPGAPPGQPAIIGPALFRVVSFNGTTEHRSGADRVVRSPAFGWVIGAGDRITARGGLRIGAGASITLQALPSGATFEIRGSAVQDENGNNIPTPAIFEAAELPVLQQGAAIVTTGAPAPQALAVGPGGVALRTPAARIDAGGGVAQVSHDPRRRVTTVGNVQGSVSVTPANPALRGLQLVPGQQVEVGQSTITPPFSLVPAPNLATVIPSPREIRAGPALVTAPSRISLRSLRSSKCVRVRVTSARPARVLVTIFSGRRSVRLFGQRQVRFTVPGRVFVCIKVPARARTFNVRTPLRFAVGYAVGARARVGERPPRPVIRPIRLVP